jgi:tetratricopeptide (TPR) repeat protein
MSEEPSKLETKQKVRELLGRATLLRARGEHEEALRVGQEAVGLEGGNWECHELVGDVLLALERPDEALSSYRRARELHQSRAVLEEKIGRAALAQAERQRSAERSQALLEGKAEQRGPRRNPSYAALYSFIVPGLGQVYNGEVLKGVVVVVAYVLLFGLTAIALRGQRLVQPSGMGSVYGSQLDLSTLLSAIFGGPAAIWIIALVLLWIYSIADAALKASRTMTSDDTGLV